MRKRAGKRRRKQAWQAMKRNPFELLPDAVEVGGALVRIDSDFRVGVAIENEMLCAP